MSELEELKKRVDELEAKVTPVKNLMTFNEAAEYLGFSRAYLYRLCYRKKIPHYKPTERKLFFFMEELDEWVRKRKSFASRH